MPNSHQASHPGSDDSSAESRSGASNAAMSSSDATSAYKFIELPFFQRLTQASLSQDN